MLGSIIDSTILKWLPLAKVINARKYMLKKNIDKINSTLGAMNISVVEDEAILYLSSEGLLCCLNIAGNPKAPIM